MMIAVPRNPLQWKALLIRVSAATAASVAESGPLEAPQEVRQDSQGDFGAEKKNNYRDRNTWRNIPPKYPTILIAMDDSDWAIQDSYSAARWRMLADFD